MGGKEKKKGLLRTSFSSHTLIKGCRSSAINTQASQLPGQIQKHLKAHLSSIFLLPKAKPTPRVQWLQMQH